MFVLTKRQKDILECLCLQEKYITFMDLSKKFSVSKRTIQNDVNQIEVFLLENNMELNKKPRMGIKVKGVDYQKQALLKNLVDVETRNFNKEERVALIKANLLCTSISTFQDLADICMVSKQTIINSFTEIEEALKKENIKIMKMQGKGIQVTGEELDIRRYFIQLMKDNPCPENIVQTLKDKGSLNNYLDKVSLLLEKIDEVGNISFNDQSDLKIIIAFIFKRINEQHYIANNIKFDEMMEQDVLLLKKIVSKYIQEDNEILYVITLLLSERMNQYSDLIDFNTNKTQDEAYEIAKLLIDALQSLQPINHSYLQDTIQGLTLHLRSAINRYRNHMEIKNELVEQIKLSVPLIYEFTNKQLHQIEKKYNLEFDDNEVAFITMYIASIFETSFIEINRVNVLLVCSFGLATSSILKSRIAQSFPGFKMIGPMSQTSAKRYLSDHEVDLVISTNDFEHLNTPVINVNPLLDYESMERIKNKLEQFSYAKMCSHFINSYASTNKIEQKKHFIFDYVPNDHIQIVEQCESWENAIQIAAKPLLEKGLVTQHYVDMMISAVNNYGTYMVMTPNTAYVHAGANDGITQNCTAILVINKPIIFGYTNAKQVSNIVILGIKNKKENDLLNIAYIFEKEKNIELLASADITTEEIVQMHD